MKKTTKILFWLFQWIIFYVGVSAMPIIVRLLLLSWMSTVPENYITYKNSDLIIFSFVMYALMYQGFLNHEVKNTFLKILEVVVVGVLLVIMSLYAYQFAIDEALITSKYLDFNAHTSIVWGLFVTSLILSFSLSYHFYMAQKK